MKYRWKCSNKIISFNTIKTCQEYRQNTQKTDILQVFLIYDFIWNNLYLYAFYRFYAEKQRFYRVLMRYYIKCVSLHVFLSFGHMILKNNRLYTFFMGAFPFLLFIIAPKPFVIFIVISFCFY